MARGQPGEETYTPQVQPEDLPRKIVPRMETVPVAQAFEGAADAILFDDLGSITARDELGSESPEGRLWGIDIAPGVWHTILPRTSRVVCFEVKPGPWKPATDKEFAVWVPPENDPAAEAYANALLGRG